jgi:chitodextrinase
VAAWSCSDSTPPSQPGGLTTTGVTATTVDLAWSAATDDVGVTGYLVDRSGAAIGTTAGLGFTVTGLACNSGYTFDVSARDAAGNSSSAATVIVRTAACSDTTAPTMPPALATSAVSQTGLTLSWQASTDAVGVTGYAVSRNGSQIATPSGTTVAVSGLSCASTYAFAVTAHDAAGNVSAAATTSQATTGCAGTASRYVAASGSDAGSCTASAPCRSLDRAYHVAAPGELVEVAGGTYPLQTINADGTKTSSTDVVFQPAAGATATLAGVSFAGARHLTLQGFHLSGWWGESAGGVADVTMRDIVSSAGFEISGADSVSVIGGSYGPVFGTLGAAPYNHVGGGSTNTLIDGVYFHDFTRSSSDVHMECLHVSSADGLTIRNSRFFNCAVFDIFLTYWSGPVTRNITIENNFFDRSRDLNGACCGYYAVQSHLDGTYSNLLIRNNSSTMAFLIVGNLSNTRMVGNVGPYYQNDCQPNITYSHNVWQGAACGSTDVNAASGFVNPGTLDLHLLPGSAAIGRGDPANYPGTDIDGDARPLGGSIDAGADER